MLTYGLSVVYTLYIINLILFLSLLWLWDMVQFAGGNISHSLERGLVGSIILYVRKSSYENRLINILLLMYIYSIGTAVKLC